MGYTTHIISDKQPIHPVYSSIGTIFALLKVLKV